jgi:hypothetical protein
VRGQTPKPLEQSHCCDAIAVAARVWNLRPPLAFPSNPMGARDVECNMKTPPLAILLALAVLPVGMVMARDDGRYANSPLKP